MERLFDIADQINEAYYGGHLLKCGKLLSDARSQMDRINWRWRDWCGVFIDFSVHYANNYIMLHRTQLPIYDAPFFLRPDRQTHYSYMSLYVAQHPSEPIIKVGMSRDPVERMETLRRENLIKKQFLLKYSSMPLPYSDVADLETTAVKVLSPFSYRNNREYFDCPLGLAIDVVKACVDDYTGQLGFKTRCAER